MLKRLLEQRRQAKAEKLFKDGYNYAVGAIVRGEESADSLRIKADNQFDKNKFDYGIEAGIHGLENYAHSTCDRLALSLG